MKQSIYRFRLAGPRHFLQKYEAYAPYAQAKDDEPRRFCSRIISGPKRGSRCGKRCVFSLHAERRTRTYLEAEKLRAGLSYPDTRQPKVVDCTA